MSKPKKTEPDFLREAAGHYLFSFPKKWTGEKIVTYLEDHPDDYSEEIYSWYLLDGVCGEVLADCIRDLAQSFKNFYHRDI